MEATRPRAFAALWVIPGILSAAALYEVTLLVDGAARGGFFDFADTVATVAFFTMLVACLGALLNAVNPLPTWAVALFAPAAAAFVTARFYTYDPYYYPTLRRFSDDGGVGTTWVLGLLVAALVACFLTRLLPRFGSIATAVVLFVLVPTSLLTAAGH